MANQKSNKVSEKTKAKLAFREKSTAEEGPQRHFSTRPEDVVKEFGDGRLIAKNEDGVHYLTDIFYIQTRISDPNRYGRLSSRLSPEQLAKLLAKDTTTS